MTDHITRVREQAERAAGVVDEIRNPFGRTTPEQESLVLDLPGVVVDLLSRLTRERMTLAIEAEFQCNLGEYGHPDGGDGFCCFEHEVDGTALGRCTVAESAADAILALMVEGEA